MGRRGRRYDGGEGGPAGLALPRGKHAHQRTDHRRPLLIAALLLSAGHTAPATAGATTKTYTDRAHGIALRSPATWTAQPGSENAGCAATIAKTFAVFVAPNSSAALYDMFGDKKLTRAALRAVGITLFKGGNTLAGPIATGRATIGKIPSHSWSDAVKASGGSTVLVTPYAGPGGKGTYSIGEAILVHHAASAKALRGTRDRVTIG